MTIIITGCSGFLGTNMVRILREKGYYTVGIDIKTPEFDWPDAFYKGDICDREFLEGIFSLYKARALFHFAAISTIQTGQLDPQRTWEVNVYGTQNLLDALHGSETVVLYASTDKVYGMMNGQEAYQEQHTSICPMDYYSYDRSKAEADRRVLRWAQAGRGNAVVFRFCNLYGEFDCNLTRIVPSGIHALLEGRPALLRRFIDQHGTARNYFRDMLYVGDWSDAMCQVLSLIKADNHTHMLGQAYNLGSTGITSMEEVLKEIYNQMGIPFAPTIDCGSALEIPMQHTDYTKAQQAFGFEPATVLSSGLRKTIAWWREYEKRFVKGTDRI